MSPHLLPTPHQGGLLAIPVTPPGAGCPIPATKGVPRHLIRTLCHHVLRTPFPPDHKIISSVAWGEAAHSYCTCVNPGLRGVGEGWHVDLNPDVPG